MCLCFKTCLPKGILVAKLNFNMFCYFENVRVFCPHQIVYCTVIKYEEKPYCFILFVVDKRLHIFSLCFKYSFAYKNTSSNECLSI